MYKDWLSVATFTGISTVDGFSLKAKSLTDMPLGVLIIDGLTVIHVNSREFT